MPLSVSTKEQERDVSLTTGGGERSAQLASLQPSSGGLEPHTSLSEHATLAGLVACHGIRCAPPLHPWQHGLCSSVAAAASSSSGGHAASLLLPSHSCGEQGHALVRRVFLPDTRPGEGKDRREKQGEAEERSAGDDGIAESMAGVLQGVVYVHSSGSIMVSRCSALLALMSDMVQCHLHIHILRIIPVHGDYKVTVHCC